ncbi:hypothetical protein SLA2020_442780 [Shorea laevis]
MASRKIFQFHAKPNDIYPTSASDHNPSSSADLFEFEEADIWNNPSHVSPLETKKTRQPKKVMIPRKIHAADMTQKVATASLPVNIPDWSKILKEDYTEHRKRESEEDGVYDEDDDDDDDDDNRLPPHEYLARTRGASFSVHEGIGRTLKGRDLRQVRNAIWKKVGFED